MPESIECVCESCENKELCPVYMGQGCLLVKEHEESLFCQIVNRDNKGSVKTDIIYSIKTNKCRIYEFSVTRNNQKIIDFIPCYRRSDHVAGMYDLVSKQFFTNAGTGDFLVGADMK